MPIEKKKKNDAAIQYPLVYVVRLCMLGFFMHYTTQNVFFGKAPHIVQQKVCLRYANVLSFSIFLILFHFSILTLTLKYTLN